MAETHNRNIDTVIQDQTPSSKPSQSHPTSTGILLSGDDLAASESSLLPYEAPVPEPDSEISRPSKRRKSFPKALDKVDELVSSDDGHSFHFDTRFSCCASETTPKFGSFNSIKLLPTLPLPDMENRSCQIPAKEIPKCKEASHEEESTTTDHQLRLEVRVVDVEGVELNE